MTIYKYIAKLHQSYIKNHWFGMTPWICVMAMTAYEMAIEISADRASSWRRESNSLSMEVWFLSKRYFFIIPKQKCNFHTMVGENWGFAKTRNWWKIASNFYCSQISIQNIQVGYLTRFQHFHIAIYDRNKNSEKVNWQLLWDHQI